MSNAGQCPRCGTERVNHVLGSLCPKCLMEIGLGILQTSDPHQAVSATASGGGQKESGFEPPTPAALGALIPQIEITELLGTGGMGAVYKGRQRSLDRLVAVKILRPDIVGNRSFADRFLREGRALGQLNHPNIVAIHDFGSANGLYYIVMEYVDGTNLRQLLNDHALEPRAVLAVVPQLCSALQYAHDHGIVHRDIKPENILIDRLGRVKIADFGLAKLSNASGGEASLTRTDQVMGTVKYMAPEQIEGSRNVDHRADIYSLGVVFYELLTGELPLGRFAAPSRKVEIDVRLDEIVLRTLEREPKQRYQHAGEVQTDVEAVMRTPGVERPGPAVNPVKSTAERTEGWLTRHLFRIAEDLHELDRPYARWVVCPLGATVAFYLVVSSFPIRGVQSIDDRVSLGVIWTVVAFVGLNMLWLARRMIALFTSRSREPENPLDLAAQVRSLGNWLIGVGLATMTGWLLLAATGDVEVGPFALWGLIAGPIVCLAGRSLRKLRRPGILPFVLAVVPMSPAVLIGLPVGLIGLRMLSRPEIRSFFEAKPERLNEL